MWGRANRREAGILFGEQADDGLARLLGEHVEIAVLKTGKDGSITATGGQLIRTPGNDVEVVDTTGAGDHEDGAQFGFDEITRIKTELL